MQLILPSGSMKVIGSFVRFCTRQIRVFIMALIMVGGFMVNANAQSDPQVIKGWDNLEEAEFLFDVYYQIVKCSSDSQTQLHLWAFNEGGMVDAVGFTLEVTDGDGTTQTYEVEKFSIGLGQSYKADCSNDEYPYLKLDLPADMDVNSMSIDITYNK